MPTNTRTTTHYLRKRGLLARNPPTGNKADPATLQAPENPEPEASNSESNQDEESTDDDEDELALPTAISRKAAQAPLTIPSRISLSTPQKSNKNTAPLPMTMPNAPRKKAPTATEPSPLPMMTPIEMLKQALCLVQSAKETLSGPKQAQVAELANRLQRILDNELPFQPHTTLLEQLVFQVQEQGKAIAQLSKPAITSAQQKTTGKSMSYAQAAQTVHSSPAATSSPVTTSIPFTTVTKKKESTKQSQKKELQKRQLVLITCDEDRSQALDSLAMRNQINKKFSDFLKVEKPVLSSITKSHSKQNIILTTTQHFDAEFLAEHKELWSPFFKFTREQRIESWAQVIAHGVPFESAFLGENGAAALKDEIETFNDISVVGRVRWLSKGRRENQRSGSIVFAVATEEIRSAILKRHRITIAGSTATVVRYLPAMPSAQCGRCQRFGHATDSCRGTACRFCAAPHKTGEHQCSSCNTIGRPCEHTVAKCINCKGTHFANSKDCEVWKSAKNIHHH